MSPTGMHLSTTYTQGKRFPDTMGQVRSTLGALYPAAFDSMPMNHTKVWSYFECHGDDTTKMNRDHDRGITAENFNIADSNVTYNNSDTKEEEESHFALHDFRQAEKSNADTTDDSCLPVIDPQRHAVRDEDATDAKRQKKDGSSASDRIRDASMDVESYVMISESDVALKSATMDIAEKTSMTSFSDKCQEILTEFSNRVRNRSGFCAKETAYSEISGKRTKQRGKVVAMGRGRGRARCQLRRSGVSQTRHRKKHTSHESSFTAAAAANRRVDRSNSERSNSEDDYDCVDFVPLIRTTDADGALMSDSLDISTKQTQRQNQRKKTTATRASEFLLEQLNSSVDSEDSFCIVFTSEPEEEEEEDPDETDCRRSWKPRNKEILDSSVEDDVCVVYTSEFDETENDQDEDQYDDEYENANETEKKKVRFDPIPVVHVMVKWNYAYRAARKGPWEEMARDNERFKGRIKSIGAVLTPILASKHRSDIWRERFAP